MKLRFMYPSLDQFEFFLATGQYKNIWLQDNAKIIAAFRSLTGLEFRQRQISVKVHDGQSVSGSRYWPMRLNVNNRTLDEKRAAFVHELGHRLLGGNGLASTFENETAFAEDAERRLGLFIFDAYDAVYGADFVKAYIERTKEIVAADGKTDKELFSEGIFRSYSVPFPQRQEKLRHLIATNTLELP